MVVPAQAEHLTNFKENNKKTYFMSEIPWNKWSMRTCKMFCNDLLGSRHIQTPNSDPLVKRLKFPSDFIVAIDNERIKVMSLYTVDL